MRIHKIPPILLICLLASAVFYAACGPIECRLGDGGIFEIQPTELSDAEMSYLLQVARGVLYGPETAARPDKFPAMFEPQRRPVVVSVALDTYPALIAHGDEQDLYNSVVAACRVLKRMSQMRPITNGWIRIDVLDASEEPILWDPSKETLYPEDRSQKGMIFNTEPIVIFTPGEIISRHLMTVKGKPQTGNTRSYMSNERLYGKIMYGCLGLKKEEGQKHYINTMGTEFTFFTVKTFSEAPDDPSRLVRYFRLQPESMPVNAQSVRQAAVDAAEHLVRSIDLDGMFIFRYRPQTDHEIDRNYDMANHAEAVYAMLDVYALTRDERLLQKAELALKYLTEKIVDGHRYNGETYSTVIYKKDNDGRFSRYKISPGGSALGIVAICRHAELTGDRQYLPKAVDLARYLTALQDETGRINRETGSHGEFTPGQVVLALLRLNAMQPDQAYIETARRAADLYAQQDLKNLDDHWLNIALKELDSIDPQPLYKQYCVDAAGRIIHDQNTDPGRKDILGGFSRRPGSLKTATYALELAAACHMTRHDCYDVAPYEQAMKLAAGYQLRCRFNAYNIIDLQYPMKAFGAFAESHRDFDILIVNVARNISSMLELYEILNEPADPAGSPQPDCLPEPGTDAENQEEDNG